MIRRLVAALLLIAGLGAVAAAVAAVAYVMSPLPSRRGRVPIPGMKAPVTVRFDRQGVPHVRAVLEVDAWRAIGFIHASDRFFQMELRRRAAWGRLSEVLGPSLVAFDKDARVNGWGRLAQRDWDAASPTERATLEAYAEGVNAFISEQTLPLEFRLAGFTPEPWTPVDSLAFGRLMQDDLSTGESVERGAFDDARTRGLAAAISFYDESVPGVTHVAPETAAILVESRESRVETPGTSTLDSERSPAGSNAWAVAGTRTASGKPLLAGDPHLAAERPGIWYAAHLTSADGLDAVGLTLAGTPGILIGHDGHVAWSLTMHQADDSDLFIEQVDWDKGLYRREDAWVPLVRSREVIRVKGAADVIVDAARTAHGPIVLRLDDPRGLALARAFASADRPQGLKPYLLASRAKSGADLLEAWSHYAGPPVNLCWADTSGSIGLKVAGAIPRRHQGDGRFPVPGWIPAYDWDGWLPDAALPAVTNPPGGFVASANDDWMGDGVRLDYPGLFSDSDRVDRARQLLGPLHAARVGDMRSMQNDVYSPYAARIVAAIGGRSFANPRAAKAAHILSTWDARADRHGPSRLFFAFIKALRRTSSPDAPRATWALLERIVTRDSAPAAVERSLADAIDTVEKEDGTDPARWSWGHAHRLVYAHPFASALPKAIAGRLAFGPVDLPGEWHTLDVAGFPLRADGYAVSHLPSARLIVDLAAPDQSRLVLPLGQSGQLFDRHASDQLVPWSSGRDAPLPFSDEAVEAATISLLTLTPAE